MRGYLLGWLMTGASLAAWAAPEPAAPGPRLDDAAFFALLDLARPELSAVREAAERQDWAAAKRGFAAHLRARRTPRWTFDPHAVGRERKPEVAKAEKALRHQLTSIGIEWAFGETIDWAFNPTTQPDSKWPANHEWTWQLSRHPMWIELGRAFHATGDERYAAEFARQLAGWVRDCPVPPKADNRPFSRWRTIEAGIRAGSVWPEVYHRFLAARAFDDEALTLFLKSYAEHALYLMRFKTGGNWLAMEANGLYHAGALFPEFKEAALWRQTALARLTAELDIQVYPDGAQVELAPGYHGVSLRNFLGPVDLAELTGCEVPHDYTAKLERMFDYYLYTMQPTRQTPALNDSGAGGVERWLELGAKLFPARDDFRWVSTRGQAGKPPAPLSFLFPYAGQAIFRTGWERDALWLCFDAGPFGYGHQHEDKLGVTLTAYGRPLLVEGGVYTYDASAWRRYVLSSRAHNVVLVDGLDQNRRKSPKETYVVQAPVPLTFQTGAAHDTASATFDEGWGPEGRALVRHTRHVFFIKPDLVVLADELQPSDSAEHLYEALFHLDAEAADSDGLRVATQGEGPGLTLTGFGADGVSVVKGQTEPVVQGWLPDSSAGYGGIRPIPTAIYRKRAAGPVTLLFALAPSPSGGKPRGVTGTRLLADALEVTFADGERRQYARGKTAP